MGDFLRTPSVGWNMVPYMNHTGTCIRVSKKGSNPGRRAIQPQLRTGRE